MKKLFLSILFLFAVILSAEACYPETTDRVVKVDGIYYAYNGNCGRRIGRWYVAGFEQDQDSVVLRNKVIIDGEEETIIDVYIIEYLHCRKYDDNIKVKNILLASPRVLVIPDGFITISSLFLPKLEKLYISETVDRTHDVCTSEYAAIYSEKLEAIIVDPKNKNLKSVDGMLFSKDGTNLLKYPAKKAGKEYSIPDDVESICYGAFSGCQLEIVYYPKQKGGIENYEQYGLSDPYEEAVDNLGFELGKTKFIGR
ncbi:MAG: hypothetical protein Q4B61_01360 [Bacteroidales bacterium]|nr:hypothetical protein [Bacteroidales bacterium]MEE1260365.1 hypothetical protein [Paludibacteraceae bacterium]